jgi:hypothetical protein
MSDEHWFEHVSAVDGDTTDEPAPARLKSTIYSRLLSQMATSGALLELSESKRHGGHLCVFETALTLLPTVTDVQSMNPCRVCHARVLGERLTRAPIFWPGCPYSEFHHS